MSLRGHVLHPTHPHTHTHSLITSAAGSAFCLNVLVLKSPLLQYGRSLNLQEHKINVKQKLIAVGNSEQIMNATVAIIM